MSTGSPSSDHSKELNRLNRILGQINGIKVMISEERECREILSQLKAVRAALRAVEANFLKEYLQRCVAQSFASEKERQKKIDEIRELFNDFHE